MRRITGFVGCRVWIEYAGDLALFEIFAALVFQSLRGSCPDRSRSTLLRALERLADIGVLVP